MKRILVALAALGDRFLATHLDKRLCDWSNVTGDDDA